MSNSEHVWKGSKDTKDWQHVHVSGMLGRTCFTLKLVTPEQQAYFNDMQTSQRTHFWIFQTVSSQEGQIAATMMQLPFSCYDILWWQNFLHK